jgi:hypothetical protein
MTGSAIRYFCESPDFVSVSLWPDQLRGQYKYDRWTGKLQPQRPEGPDGLPRPITTF